MSFKIVGTGHCVPERVVTNEEMSTIVETSDEWIVQRVGVSERRVCTTETTLDLAKNAALAALEMSGVKAGELDMIICATVSSDYASPSLACLVQRAIGATCPSMDINAACSGFIYLLDTAAGFFARKKVKKMLIVGGERLSRIVDWTDRSTCVIFGDGAGAMVLDEGDSYISSKLFARGGDEVLRIPLPEVTTPFHEAQSGRPYIYMNGQETFKFAVNAMCTDVLEVTEAAGIKPEDVAMFFPHQANVRIIDAASRKLKLPNERFNKNIHKYGNTSSASIPMLVDEANREGRLKKGDYIVMCAFGAGLSSGACVVRWEM